jgi:hypothetical protein
VTVHRNWLEATSAVVFGIAVLALVPLGVLVGFPTWLRILLVVEGVVLGPAMFWYARVGVYETTDGIKLRTRFHTRDLTWEEVERFEYRSTLNWRGARRVATVVLKDGSRIELSGDWPAKRVDRLNDALRKAGSATGTG